MPDPAAQIAIDGRLPDPIVSPTDGSDAEHEAMTSDSVGLALLVVLDTLPPAERLAFVLHDTFGVPFDEIALITGRSPAAARQLASRGRRRVRDQAPAPDPDLARQWEVLDAFEAASREGDFEALVALLDPNIMLREDGGAGRESVVARGARAVAERTDRRDHRPRGSRPARRNRSIRFPVRRRIICARYSTPGSSPRQTRGPGRPVRTHAAGRCVGHTGRAVTDAPEIMACSRACIHRWG
jgi:Sigma-70, region 4